MAKLFLLCVLLNGYPYSLTPGGVKADYYASRDFPAWVDMEFAGEIYWVHTTIHKGEGLTDDGRRARCGNHVRTELPPGAQKLPPAFKFLVPILDNPLPGLNDEPPGLNLTPSPLNPPLLTSIPNPLDVPGLIEPFPIVPILIPTCDELKNNNCKKKKKPSSPTATPEPSTWVLIATGLAVIMVGRRVRHGRRRNRFS